MADPDEYLRRTGLRGYASDVRWALSDRTPIPFRRRLQATRAGFKPESAVAFEFGKNDPRDYLPDTSWRPLSKTNGPAATSLLANKLMFYLKYQDELPLPRVHGFVAAGNAVPLPGPTPIATLEQVFDHLREVGPLFVKPMGGDRGRGVHLLEWRGGELLRDHKPASERELLAYLGNRDGSLFVEKVEQAEYAMKIFPDSTNSLRLTVFGGAGTAYQPFLAVAGHRFGRVASVPVDNTAKGGLVCSVDLETGILGRGRNLPKNAAAYNWFEEHPDTRAPLMGVAVPGFAEIVESLLDFSRRHAYLAYVGWDVVKTDTGFMVIEANHHSSLRMQVAKPFLQDERVVAFLAYHGLPPTRSRKPERRSRGRVRAMTPAG